LKATEILVERPDRGAMLAGCGEDDARNIPASLTNRPCSQPIAFAQEVRF
jgi:hypothetical protein